MGLLKYLGLTTIKEKQEAVDKLSDELAEYKVLFDFDLMPEEKSFKDFQRERGAESLSFNKELWDEWYNMYHRRQYAAYKVRGLSVEPILLNEFLMAFSKFDFEDVHKHMTKVNWTWGDLDKVPTIELLKDAVLTLIPSTFEIGKMDNWIMSGGFKVCLGYESKGKGYCKIEFEKNQDNEL